MKIRPFGLRWGRLREWARLMRDNETPIGWREVRAMIGHVARAAWQRLRSKGPPRERLRAEYRICRQCPFHDPELRRCMLCGCFTVYKIATGARCAAKEQNPESPLGYGT